MPDAPETNENALEAPDPSDTPPEPGDHQDGTEDDTPDVAKLRREAAGHRAKLREVEAERDALAQQRDALAATVLGDALRGTGVSTELLATAGHEVAEFISEDGSLDRAAITAAGREVAKQFGIRAGRSPHTGTGAERPESKKSWADAIQQ